MKLKKRKRILCLLLAELVILVLLTGFVYRIHSKYDGIHYDNEAEKSIDTDDHLDEGTPLATLLFASDYQYEEGFAEPKDTLGSIIDAATEDGKDISGVILCGDYSNEYGQYDYQVSPETSISEIKELIAEKIPGEDPKNTVFNQGNHDALTESISDSGLHEYDDYLIYVLNTQNDFPWCQGETAGSLAKVKNSSEKMKKSLDRLIEEGETRPVIIAGHVPLHFSARTSTRHTTGDNLYSSLIFDVVNEAAKSLDIIYLFGHDHSKGWDCYLGGAVVYKPIGDTILIPKYEDNAVNTDEYSINTLNFTYLNAGYAGYYMNCGPEEVANGTMDQYHAADESLTGTICEVYSDKIVLTRYDVNGLHSLSAEGCADPYKNGIDQGLIQNEYHSTAISSPQVINRHKNH